MQRNIVKSSNISSVGYDPGTSTLEVESKSGGIFHYAGVEQRQFDELMAAESIGKHFHGNIRKCHECRRVE